MKKFVLLIYILKFAAVKQKALPLELSWQEHVICNLGVVGSNPTRGSPIKMLFIRSGKTAFFLFILFHFFVYEILPHSQPTELK